MPEALETKTLAKLTTEIVAAYVAHQQIAGTDLPAVIGAVGQRLAALAIGKEIKEAKPEPAVPVRRSVGPDHLVCLVCGQKLRTLKRHLSVAHGLTPGSYRELFRLGRDYPLVAPAYAAQRAAIAREAGLGGARPKPEPAPPPAARARRRRQATAAASQPAPRRARRTKSRAEGTAAPA